MVSPLLPMAAVALRTDFDVTRFRDGARARHQINHAAAGSGDRMRRGIEDAFAAFNVVLRHDFQISLGEFQPLAALANNKDRAGKVLPPGSSLPLGVRRRPHDPFESPFVPPLHPCDKLFHFWSMR